MNKILFVGDVHFNEHNLANRKDIYFESIMLKMKESFNIALEKKCDIVFLLGDLFHKFEPSGMCRNEVLKFFMDPRWTFRKISLIGNHDVKNHKENLNHSALGTLMHTGCIEIFDMTIEQSIYCVGHEFGIEKKIQETDYSKMDFTIFAAHANIVDEGYYPFESVRYSDIRLPKSCKLIISGHYHKNMFAENNNILFINPGSLCRNEYTEYNLLRKIQVVYVEFNENHFDYEMIILKDVKRPTEIFDFEIKQIKKSHKEELENFVKSISLYNTFNGSSEIDKYELLRMSGKDKKIDDDVVELSIKTLMQINEDKKYDSK